MNTTAKNDTDILELLLDGTSTEELLEILAVHEQAMNACNCSGKCGSDYHKAMFFAITWHLEARYDVWDFVLSWDIEDGRTYTEALSDAIKGVR